MTAPINTSSICTTCGKPAYPHPYRHPITQDPTPKPSRPPSAPSGISPRPVTIAVSAESMDKIRPDEAYARWQQARSNR